MSMLKICSLILCYFFARVAVSGNPFEENASSIDDGRAQISRPSILPVE